MMRGASARRTLVPGAGRDVAQGPGPWPTCAPNRPICLARSVPNAAPGRQLLCLALPPRRCSTTSTRSRAALPPKAHAVIVLDQAGWHTTGKLRLPENLSLLPLPPKSPELNPVENVWQFLRQNKLSNRIFGNYEAILAAACDAWNSLLADPARITSIGTRQWATIAQD